jgi:hypothetical protein
VAVVVVSGTTVLAKARASPLLVVVRLLSTLPLVLRTPVSGAPTTVVEVTAAVVVSGTSPTVAAVGRRGFRSIQEGMPGSYVGVKTETSLLFSYVESDLYMVE